MVSVPIKKMRNPGCCTTCAKQLPESKRGWGLIWDDGETGICAKCLYDMRVSTGYFNRTDKKLAPKTRESQRRIATTESPSEEETGEG